MLRHLASAKRRLVDVDCGAPARHGFDDHAHAGTLSFELCYDGERMIVNCGAHPWSKEWRQVQRFLVRAGGDLLFAIRHSSIVAHGKGRPQRRYFVVLILSVFE